MIVNTFQSIEVVEILKKTDYKPTVCKLDIYKDIMECFGLDGVAPVFGFYGEWKDCYFGGSEPDGLYLITLDVPEDFYFKMEFYDWSDYMFFSQEKNFKAKKDYLDSFKNQRHNSCYDDLQIILPFIKRDWILSIEKWE